MKTKILLLLTIAMLGCMVGQAQTEKGKWLVGASTSGLNLRISSINSSFSIQLNPEVGYFFTDNLAAGVRLGLGFGTASFNDSLYSRSVGIRAGFFGRYYVPLTERLKLPIDLELGYGRSASILTGSSSSNGYGTSGAHTGLAIFLNDAISLDLLLGVDFVTFYNSFGSNTSGAIDGQFGFSLYLDCKNKE